MLNKLTRIIVSKYVYMYGRRGTGRGKYGGGERERSYMGAEVRKEKGER